MGQRPGLLPIIFSLLLMLMIGCDRTPTSTPTSNSNQPPIHSTTQPATRPITVASLSPAATEILIGMGAMDRLVAVSNYDPHRQETKNLPRVGDYQTTDWERLAALRPGVMVTQFAADRLPQGMIQKAHELDIRLVNVSITRLDDIYIAMEKLGDAIGMHDAGVQAAAQLRAKLADIGKTCTGPKVKALIVLDENAHAVAGRDNYLNDVLEAVGGENAIPGGQPYPSIDPEFLAELNPTVIFQLLPDSSPQVIGRARQVWTSMPTLRAVRDGRVYIFSNPLFLQPTQEVGELAQRFAKALNEARGAP